MTLPQILNRPEIAKQVYEKYPVSKAEFECATEKNMMDRLRWIYGKKLIDQEREKPEYTSNNNNS